MNRYSVRKYQTSDKVLWDTFVAKAKNSTFLFYRDFMEYHNHKFDDFSLLFFDDKDNLKAIFPANILEDTVYSHQGLTYGGLVFCNRLKFNSVIKIFKTLLQYLENEHLDALIVKQLPNIYCHVPSEEQAYLMFLLEAQLLRRDLLSVVDLKAHVKFSKDRKDGVKRGRKNKLIIKEDDTFEAFWNTILIPNLEQKHQAKPVHSLEEIQQLKAKFPNNIKQFNVYHDNKIVAGTTIFITDKVAHSQYISGNHDKNQLGSLDFLHHHLITQVFADKVYFDFGISNENNGKQVNTGLQYWKEGFGGRGITQDFYKINVKNHEKLNNVLI
ncbi:GNAT family N-acetyltransferase [Mangrovimonas spongiae]|uniref:GNAT family N-acetyltransferase n=1 Tax=Mangrovimonas spongiae TaxID=2494697 RepID=A0A3R9PIR8_9FLAO|nr:GNAT family N-acetyltransferase [Mangrovimonas spongiae]RSK39165.1 GNAT family N-acetyltransferase [Mangrovimonas spongiae]